MSLANPPWLLAALGVAVALVFLWRAADRRRAQALERFAALQLLPDLTSELSRRRRGVKRALLVGAIGLAGLALAGPEYGFTWQETKRRGIDVLIAIDTSRSMLAQDVAPNRLERAKLAIIDLVDKLGGDRVGLIAFAGSAFLQCPLTLDHGAFLESLQALQPGVIPTPGSDLASALRTAEEALQSEARNVKLLVLFSDGEDLGGGAIAAAQKAAEQGIRVFTVGIGSEAGELIPLPGKAGGTEFLKDPQGQFVKSRLDADTLRKVAELTGGFYEPLGRRGEAVDAIYDRALAPLPKEELASRMRRVPLDRFQWPLAVVLLCLAVEMLLRERRTRGTTVAGLMTLVALAAASGAHAASPQEAQRLYSAGDYDKALAEYRGAASGSDNPQLDFNLGAAAYKAGEFGDAAAAFARALRSEDAKVQEQGFYNLGNAQFRVGQQTHQANPQQTMQAWQQALDAYESALKVDPKDEDARFNRDFVKHALEELQKQQQQQQNDKDQKKKDDKDKKDQQQQQQQGGQDQQKDEQGDQQKSDQQQAKQDQSQQQEQKKSPGEQNQQQQDKDKPEQNQQAKADPKQGDHDESKKSPGDGSPEARNQPPQEPGEQTAGAPQQVPGQMSPAEAKELLDSVKDGEATLQELQAKQPRRASTEQERDW